MCLLKPGCHNFAIGSGRNDSDLHYELCGVTYDKPSSGSVCISKNIHNNTICSSVKLDKPTCQNNVLSSSYLLAKIDTAADGWGEAIQYTIKEYDSDVELVKGSLIDGEYEIDSICLMKNSCYTFEISNGYFAEDVVWVMCGYDILSSILC